jgi:site-specific DNA recombinase
VNGLKTIDDMKAEAQRLDKKIENLAFSIADSATSSRSLVTIIEQLEKQKEDIERQIEETEGSTRTVDVTEEEIRNSYSKARELFVSGQLPEMQKLINLYLERVVVYREYVEIFLHIHPSFCAVNHETYKNGLANINESPTFYRMVATREELIGKKRTTIQ